MLIGLSSFTTKHHIARATLEATCYQTRAIVEAMVKDTQVAGEDSKGSAGLQRLAVDGGMTASDTMMQIQADTLGIQVDRPLSVAPLHLPSLRVRSLTYVVRIP